ncbi:hypothetical protein [Algibacter sp. R77976]|uniref:hypothetical protein n=1 Tax=Algibacter sp. R77976 TaxID=3093873 RepID=UPI0037C5E209
MTKSIQKFILYFIISSLVYYSFLVVETISLYFNEFGFDLANAILVSFSSIVSVINFGVFISIILITVDLLKEKVRVFKILKFGLVVSLIFGGVMFFLSNNVIPELRITSFLNRYENARKEVFSSEERAKKTRELKNKDASMMSIRLINKFSDSLENQNSSQKKIIADLFQKIPDSIIESDFSKREITKYDISKNKLTPNFSRRELINLKMEIRKNKALRKQLRTSNWKKNERYLNIFLTVFLACFGIVIGTSFKNQVMFSLVCIGIVIYSQILTLLTAMTDYFINEKNLIGMIFKLALILAVFLYLVNKMKTNKNTSINT